MGIFGPFGEKLALLAGQGHAGIYALAGTLQYGTEVPLAALQIAPKAHVCAGFHHIRPFPFGPTSSLERSIFVV